MPSTIAIERHGPVGWLIFDRPEARNALDATMFRELEEAWLELDADPAVRVIVNTGNGPAFHSGLDMVQLARDKEALRTFSRQTRDAALRFTAWHLGILKPVIAAVNGICAGGGLHFLVDADLVIAASDAELVEPHSSVGQVVAFEGIALLRKSPMEPVMRMVFTGRHERMSAARAHQLGIVSEVVDPPERLRERAQEIGEAIATHPPELLAAMKKAMWNALEVGLSDARRAALLHVDPAGAGGTDHTEETR